MDCELSDLVGRLVQAGEVSDDDVLALLTAAGLRYQMLRLAGRSAYEAWRTAAGWLGMHADPLLRSRFPEATETVR